MKNLIRSAAIFFVAMLLLINSSESGEAAKKNVAVMPMENVSGYNAANVAEIMTEQLIVAITNSGQYGVVERVQMGTVLKEQGFQNISSSNPVEIGAMSGAEYTVIGKITMAEVTEIQTEKLIGALFKGGELNLGEQLIDMLTNGKKAHIELDVRFVDNKTGEIVFAKAFSGTTSAKNDTLALSGACKEAAENFLKELQNSNPFTARVADFSGLDIYIDQGSDSGLHKDEVLKVEREGSPIVVNGKIVGMKSTYIGRVIVVAVFSEYSICRAENGEAVMQGDIVRRDSQ